MRFLLVIYSRSVRVYSHLFTKLREHCSLSEYDALSSLKHSAKLKKYSAKCLPSVTLDKESSTNSTSVTASLSSTFYRALTECHSVLGKEKLSSRRLVMETAPLPSVLGDTRQRDYFFAECPSAYTRQRGVPLSVSLPSALGGTRQSLLLYRVSGS
jgi:hypothetical protein